MSFDKLCEKSRTGAGTVESAVRERCPDTDAAEAIIRLYWRLTYTEKVVGLMRRLRVARLRVWLDTDHDFQEAEYARHTDGAVCSAVFGEGMRADVDVTPDAQTRRLFRPMLTLPIGYKTKYNIRVNDVSTGFSWTASDSEWSDRSGRTARQVDDRLPTRLPRPLQTRRLDRQIGRDQDKDTLHSIQ